VIAEPVMPSALMGPTNRNRIDRQVEKSPQKTNRRFDELGLL
jgi:hypothetical protein